MTFPLVRWAAAECGLACLAILAAHHGHRTDVSEPRRRFSVSLRGADPTTMARVVGELDVGAVTRAVVRCRVSSSLEPRHAYLWPVQLGRRGCCRGN